MTEKDITVKFVRDYLEGLPCPICTKDISDEQMEKLIKDVNDYTKMICRVKTIDLNDEITEDIWFAELEEFSIKEYKMPYYEDMEN